MEQIGIIERIRGFFQPKEAEEQHETALPDAIKESPPTREDFFAERMQSVAEEAAANLQAVEDGWDNPQRALERVEAEAASIAAERGDDFTTPEGKIAAFSAIADKYADVALDLYDAAAAMPEADVKIASAGKWQTSGLNMEEREIVVETDSGFHPGFESSYMGGEGALYYAENAFPTIAEAEALAPAYQAGEVAFERALADLSGDAAKPDHDSAVATDRQRFVENFTQAWGDIQDLPPSEQREQLETTFLNSVRELPPEAREIIAVDAPNLVAEVEEKAASLAASDAHSL